MFRAIVAFACCLPLVASAQEAAVRPEDIRALTGHYPGTIAPAELRAFRRLTPRLDHRFVLALEDVVRFANPSAPEPVQATFDGVRWTISAGGNDRFVLFDNADFEELTLLLARVAGRSKAVEWKSSSLLEGQALWDELDAVNAEWSQRKAHPEVERRAAHALVSLAASTADLLEIGDRLYGRAWALLAIAGGLSAPASRDGVVLAEVLGYSRFARSHANDLPPHIEATEPRPAYYMAKADTTLGTLEDPELTRLRRRVGMTDAEAADLGKLGVFGLTERLVDRMTPRTGVPFDSDTEAAAVRTTIATSVDARLSATRSWSHERDACKRVLEALGQATGMLGDVGGYFAAKYTGETSDSTLPYPLDFFDGRWPAVGARPRAGRLRGVAFDEAGGPQRAFVEIMKFLDERPAHRAIALAAARLYSMNVAAIEALTRAFVAVRADEVELVAWASLNGDGRYLQDKLADATAATRARVAAAKALLAENRASAEDISKAFWAGGVPPGKSASEMLAFETFEAENGPPERAERMLRTWLDAHPQAPVEETFDAKLRLARMLRLLGRADEALTLVRSLPDVELPALQRERTLALAAAGKVEEADALAKALLARQSDWWRPLQVQLAWVRRDPAAAARVIAGDNGMPGYGEDRDVEDFLDAYRLRPDEEKRAALRTLGKMIAPDHALEMAGRLSWRNQADLARVLACSVEPPTVKDLIWQHRYVLRSEGREAAEDWVKQHWNPKFEETDSPAWALAQRNPEFVFAIPPPAGPEVLVKHWYARAVALVYLRERSGPRVEAVRDFFRSVDSKAPAARWGRVLMGLAPIASVMEQRHDAESLPRFLHFLGVLAEMHDDLATANEWYLDGALVEGPPSRVPALAYARAMEFATANRSLARLQAEGLPHR